jgi:hypothetical protein
LEERPLADGTLTLKNIRRGISITQLLPSPSLYPPLRHLLRLMMMIAMMISL